MFCKQIFQKQIDGDKHHRYNFAVFGKQPLKGVRIRREYTRPKLGREI